MSSFLLFLVLLLVAAVGGVEVPVPYSVCSVASAHIKINSANSDVWPPVKGDLLNISLIAVVDETVTAGEYSVGSKIDGFPVPGTSNASISELHPLPWTKGSLELILHTEIPSKAPSGSYSMSLVAVDQNKEQLFCIAFAFRLMDVVVGEGTRAEGPHGGHLQSRPDSVGPNSSDPSRSNSTHPSGHSFGKKPKLEKRTSRN